jgi:hypothetical protein
MEPDRRGSLHPEREFLSMGLPISFGNSNSRQARAAITAASRRPIDGAVAHQSIVDTTQPQPPPPPPPPPSQLFTQTPRHTIGLQLQSTFHDAKMHRRDFVPPPPPSSLHIQPMLHKQHQHAPHTGNPPHFHFRAAPYGPSVDNFGRKQLVSGGHHAGSRGPRSNAEHFFKDSMFGNPWRSCGQNALRSA